MARKGVSAQKGPQIIVMFSGDWGSYKFLMKRSQIIGVKDIGITVSVETETKNAGNENYVALKNLNTAEITITGIFSAALGVKDVRKEVFKLMNICRQGRKGHLYCGTDKLYAPMMMATNAKTVNLTIGANGKWDYCEVMVTFAQCEKYGGGTDGEKKSGSGGGKKRGGGGSRYPADDERRKQMQEAKRRAQEEAKRRTQEERKAGQEPPPVQRYGGPQQPTYAQPPSKLFKPRATPRLEK